MADKRLDPLLCRLRWVHDAGLMYSDGVTVVLRNAPKVPGMASYQSIIYVPQRGQHRVLPVEGAWRDLSDAECEVLAAWLKRVSESIHRAMALAATFPLVYAGVDRRQGARRSTLGSENGSAR